MTTMRIRTIVTCCMLAMLFCLPLTVTASDTSGGAISAPRPGDGFAPTKSVRGTIIKIDAEKNLLVVRDQKERELILKLTKNTKFKAEDGKDFGGRKKLTLSDILPDIGIKVLFEEEQKNVIEVKVLKKQS